MAEISPLMYRWDQPLIITPGQKHLNNVLLRACGFPTTKNAAIDQGRDRLPNMGIALLRKMDGEEAE